MTELAEALTDLEAILPRSASLIGEPDIAATNGRSGKPGSRAPWNPAAAAATFDTIALIGETRNNFLFIVTGHTMPHPQTYRGTARALAVILSLSHAVPHEYVKRAARDFAHRVTVMQQLAAIDEVEQFRKIEKVCPYCPEEVTGEVYFYPLAGMVACVRGAVCRDMDGNPPKGYLDRDRFGDPCIRWQDGLVR